MRGFDHVQFPRSPLGTAGTMTPHLCTKYDETPPPGGGYFQKNWVGACGTLPETLALFQAKSVIFPDLFKAWSPGTRRVTGARDKLLRHLHGWRKH